MKVLFVCTGNTCRSPMAAALAQALFESNSETASWKASSAGIQVWDEDEMSIESLQVLSECYGIEVLNREARAVNEEQCRTADEILTMTEAQALWMQSQFPDQSFKIHSLTSAATGKPGDLADPYGQSYSCYVQTAERLSSLLDQWYQTKKEKTSSESLGESIK